MSKDWKPGELWMKHQEKMKKAHEKHEKHMKRKKSYSESDMGSMKGWKPVEITKPSKGLEFDNTNSFAPSRVMGKIGGGKLAKTKHSKKHKKNWIAGAIKHPGALHRELGVKAGHKIPAKTLAKAAKKGGVEGKRARLAETLKSFHHKKHRKEHSAEAMKGLREFVNEEAKEKKTKHHKHKKGMHCKTCTC